MSDENPTVFGGRYELHRRLARGGMADVFLARDQLLGRPVAVKVLFPEYATDPKFVERFRREAQAAANLNHPNIVSIYDWGEELGTYYIVMEYVEGQSLAQILRRDGTLTVEQVTRVALDVSAALGFAHDGGVVHRDVKPGNVLVSPKGEMKVADFGIATALSANADANLTQTGAVMGTATYFSPEQAQGHQVDRRSDLYSLGVVMYEMLVGKPPFTGETPVSIAYKHVQEPIVPVSDHGVDIPPALAAITMKLLSKNPDNRYRTADALQSDLDRFRQGQAIVSAGGAGQVPQAPGGPPPGAPPLNATTALPAQAAQDTHRAPAMNPVYNDPPRRRVGLVLVGILTSLLILAGFLILLQRNLTADDNDPDDTPDTEVVTEVEIPPVGGRGEADATSTLQAQNLVVARRPVADNTVPIGQVISTEPPVGTKVATGTTVTLVVSTGASLEVVPAVTAMTENEALQVLSGAGFQPQTQNVTSAIAPEGEVVSQDPPAQALAPPGSTVLIQVSAGTEEIPIPDVRGQELDAARALLESEGFVVSDVLVTEPDEDIERDLVARTEPEAGDELAPGGTVIVVLSDGPEDILLPSFIGVPKADAFAALEELGLVPAEFGQFVNNPDLVGRVVSTNPLPNTVVAPGDQIQVVTGLLDPTADQPGPAQPQPTVPPPSGGQGDGVGDSDDEFDDD